MKIIWAGPGQHTKYGTFVTGQEIDAKEAGIPDEILGAWQRQGMVAPASPVEAPHTAADRPRLHKKTVGKKPR